MVSKDKQKLRNIPAVSTILERKDIKALVPRWSFTYVSYEAKKQVLLSRKKAQKTGKVEGIDAIAQKIINSFTNKQTTLIKPVINATGVALHTNLGRAPLDEALMKTVCDNSVSYCNLEFDLAFGKRSKRGTLAGEMAAVLAGAEAGVVVNNNAGAVLLVVSCFARDKEVLVSRGELVQIGGGFRIPEILIASGARLKEVGTTNRTVLMDYSKSVNENTGLIMKVHKSNFEIKGFVEEVSPSELSTLARKKRIPMLYDLGSGMVDSFGLPEFKAEPDIASAIRSNSDMVCFSGDKLLGGPQAGIIIGRGKYITALRNHPLYRPLRPDKLCLSALEQTLLAYLVAPEKIKLKSIFEQGISRLEERAKHISFELGLDYVTPSPLKSTAGGGSTPSINYDSYGLVVRKNIEKLDIKLRNFDPPVVVRKGKDKIMLDLSTVLPGQDDLLLKALRSCLL
ncbi:MAG: L-seryl-tRNA(Sec) selenium transferase [Candidatus Zixiibacteriota bacterium]|nr:MAG: L-seryl-tRNA(Sec) selenium transferase [candidate division Zixibacteria bacterium]